VLENKIKHAERTNHKIMVFFDPIEYSIERREGFFAGRDDEHIKPPFTKGLDYRGDRYEPGNI